LASNSRYHDYKIDSIEIAKTSIQNEPSKLDHKSSPLQRQLTTLTMQMMSLPPTNYVMASPVECDEQYLSEGSVRAFLVDYFDDLNTLSGKSRECWNAFYRRNHSVKYKLVRPSGEATDSEGLVNQYTSREVSLVDSSLVNVDSITFLTGAKSAIVTFKADHVLSWFGTETSLQLVVSGIVEIEDGDIKLVHEHQSNGIPARGTSAASKVDTVKPQRNSHRNSFQEPSSPTQSMTSRSTSPERQVPFSMQMVNPPFSSQQVLKGATSARIGDSLVKPVRTQDGRPRVDRSSSMELYSPVGLNPDKSDWMTASVPIWADNWSGEDFTTLLNEPKARASRRRSFQPDLTPSRPAWREDKMSETPAAPPLYEYMKKSTSEEMLTQPRRRKCLAVSREVLNLVSRKSRSNPQLSPIRSPTSSMNQPLSSVQNATWGQPSHSPGVRVSSMVALTSTSKKTLSSAAKKKIFQDIMMAPAVRRASLLGS
jgi:Protein of unknown function (DUF3804)